MSSLLWALYEVVAGLALVTAGPFLLVRRGRHYLQTLNGRLGGGDAGGVMPAEVAAGVPPGAGGAAALVTGAPPGTGAGRGGGMRRGPLWLHAVSVGEVGVAATLARGLPREIPLLVTTVTPTGQALARRLFAGRAAVAYLPFELGPAVTRFWRRFSPGALVLVEGDYWPLLLREARRHGIPMAVVNGRVGDRSFARLRQVRRFAGLLFDGIERFGMQSPEDRDRLAALGVAADRLTVTGNLKFETAVPPENPELLAGVRRLAAGRPVLVAGSTMAGEEEQVAAAFTALGGGSAALLVVAPRHPERWDEVDRLLRRGGHTVLRRSTLTAEAVKAAGAATPPAPDILLLDSLGELAGLYGAAAAAYIGGTLVPTGGHNPLEAARHGIPIAVGPSMHNFRDMAERFDRAGAWQRVAGAADLGRAWQGWLADPGAARRQGELAARLMDENRGALEQTLAMLTPLLAHLQAGLETAADPSRTVVRDAAEASRVAAPGAREFAHAAAPDGEDTARTATPGEAAPLAAPAGTGGRTSG